MINVSSEKENDLAVTFELIFKIWLRYIAAEQTLPIYQSVTQVKEAVSLDAH